MNVARLAADQLERGTARLRDAERAFRERRWPDTLRFCQEATELVLKALLRAMAVEVPKRHDVGPALESVRSDLPAPVRRALPQILRLSSQLADRRALAMYGDEIGGRPATELFQSRDEARRYLEESRGVVALVRDQLRPSRPRPSRRRTVRQAGRSSSFRRARGPADRSTPAGSRLGAKGAAAQSGRRAAGGLRYSIQRYPAMVRVRAHCPSARTAI